MVFDRKDFVGVNIEENGIIGDSIRFVIDNQLKRRDLWEKFAEVFSTHEDDVNARWRGEYFGKQMRGAVIAYEFTKDEELYEIMTTTVKSLLSRQDELGRFSTYTVPCEFDGWDMWCRKYVLVGMIYYHEICKDENLKNQIIIACKKHLDYILEKIGEGEGKLSITDTSPWWGCVNSCTILEPTVELYKITKEKRYLDFAEYIISTGGCKDCNLIDLALKGEIYPYEYPVVKAYEMMSFYEGLVAYYEVTGNTKYLDATVKFIDAVAKTDITIIGCSGCTHELFDNSSVRQTEYHENIMQETCVTVTWMRVLRRLYLITKDAKYINRFEISAYNALYGSLNTELNKQIEMCSNTYYEAMAFDSYSPLYMNTRGRGIGGFNEFKSGGYYGCCTSIGACGVSIVPFTAIMHGDDGVYVNYPINGKATITDLDDKNVELKFSGDYFVSGKVSIEIKCSENCRLNLKIRKPEWSKEIVANGEVYSEEGYFTLNGNFNDGDKIEIVYAPEFKTHILNGKIAFTYGAITLASDEIKAGRDIKTPLSSNEVENITVLSPQKGELIRIKCDFKGGDSIILTDYQSCGKKWLSDTPLMTVWFNLVK